MQKPWTVSYQENIPKIDNIRACRQMSDFEAIIHLIRFPLGSAPDPAGGAYSASSGKLTALTQTPYMHALKTYF